MASSKAGFSRRKKEKRERGDATTKSDISRLGRGRVSGATSSRKNANGLTALTVQVMERRGPSSRDSERSIEQHVMPHRVLASADPYGARGPSDAQEKTERAPASAVVVCGAPRRKKKSKRRAQAVRQGKNHSLPSQSRAAKRSLVHQRVRSLFL